VKFGGLIAVTDGGVHVTYEGFTGVENDPIVHIWRIELGGTSFSPAPIRSLLNHVGDKWDIEIIEEALFELERQPIAFRSEISQFKRE
jgi:hypothetical protein